jgi:hypothetical protein
MITWGSIIGSRVREYELFYFILIEATNLQLYYQAVYVDPTMQ